MTIEAIEFLKDHVLKHYYELSDTARLWLWHAQTHLEKGLNEYLRGRAE